MQKVGLPSTLSPGIPAMLLFKRGNYERHAAVAARSGQTEEGGLTNHA